MYKSVWKKVMKLLGFDVSLKRKIDESVIFPKIIIARKQYLQNGLLSYKSMVMKGAVNMFYFSTSIIYNSYYPNSSSTIYIFFSNKICLVYKFYLINSITGDKELNIFVDLSRGKLNQ